VYPAVVIPLWGGLRASDGSSETRCRGDANVDLARKAGLALRSGTEPRFREVLAVDADGRSSLPGVWAAGTAAGVSVHTSVTAGHVACVATNIISCQKGERYVWHDVLPPRS
jgi:thioredoxin reductase (NADPH)